LLDYPEEGPRGQSLEAVRLQLQACLCRTRKRCKLMGQRRILGCIPYGGPYGLAGCRLRFGLFKGALRARGILARVLQKPRGTGPSSLVVPCPAECVVPCRMRGRLRGLFDGPDQATAHGSLQERPSRAPSRLLAGALTLARPLSTRWPLSVASDGSSCGRRTGLSHDALPCLQGLGVPCKALDP